MQVIFWYYKVKNAVDNKSELCKMNERKEAKG